MSPSFLLLHHLDRINLYPHHAAAGGDECGHQQRGGSTPVIGEPGREAGGNDPAHVRAHIHHARQSACMGLGEIGRHAPVGADGEIQAANQVGRRNGTWSLFWN